MIEGQEDVTWPQWVALAQACEEHGVGTLFRSDHYLSVEGHEERGSLDAWTTLAGLAAVTTRLRLGVLVSPATFRHPSVLAKNVTAVDHISGGRVELGIGAGWNEREHEAYGFDVPGARRRAWSCSRSSSRSCAAPGPTGRSRTTASTTGWSRRRRAAEAGAAAAPAAHHRRRREAAHRAPRRAVRRRVQHRLRHAGRVRRAARRGRAAPGGTRAAIRRR